MYFSCARSFGLNAQSLFLRYANLTRRRRRAKTAGKESTLGPDRHMILKKRLGLKNEKFVWGFILLQRKLCLIGREFSISLCQRLFIASKARGEITFLTTQLHARTINDSHPIHVLQIKQSLPVAPVTSSLNFLNIISEF